MTLRRSCLVVPGHSAKMQAKALGAGSDEVVFDLEDAVAPDAKEVARAQLRETLSAPEWRERQVAIRVNAAASGEQEADLARRGPKNDRAFSHSAGGDSQSAGVVWTPIVHPGYETLVQVVEQPD